MHKVKPRWLPIEGVVEIGDGTLSYVGKKTSTPKKSTEGESETATGKTISAATVKSDTYFESGDITGEIRFSTPDPRLFFRLGAAGEARTSVGFGVGGNTYGLLAREGKQGKEIDSSGRGTVPPQNQWIRFRIRVRGSQLVFFLEDIQILQGTVNLQRAQIEIRFVGEGKTELRSLAVEALRPQAFVVMQFTDEYTALFREVIDPVCTDFGYEVIRGDNVYTNGLIIEDITRSIRECSIVIADITPNNANVYYELGFAHGIGKPAILLSDRNREKLPFDISGFRLLFYDNTIGGKKHVEEALRKHLDAIRGK